jgi:hypothetical protein
MNFRLTAILFGTIAVLGVALLILTFTGDDKPSADVLLEEFVGAKPEEIDAVEFERDGGARVKFVRTDKERNRWEVVEPYTAKADGAAVLELVGALLKAKPTAHPELSSNPAAHGLQPASLRVILRAGERSSSVSLGDVTSGARGVVFVTTSARPKRPMASPRSAFEPLFRESGGGKAGDLAKWVSDYRARSVFAADTRGAGDDVTNISLTHNGKTLALERAGDGWKFVSPAGWGDADSLGDVAATPGTFTGVNRLLGAITNMQAMTRDDFVAEPKPEDLERFGVNDNSPGVIKVELKNKDGETTTAFIGKKDVPAAAVPPAHPGMPETGEWWVRVVGQPGVIRANAPDLGGLAAVIEKPDPLRDRTLLAVDRFRIDGIDLANGATKLRKTANDTRNPWRLYGKPEYGDPQAATGVDQILNVLLERRTVQSLPAPNPANFAPGELKGTIKLWVDGFEVSKDPKADPKAEPKEKGKPIVLEFGKREADGTIHVRRTLADGAQAYFLMPEKVKLPAAIESIDLLALANKSRLELLDSGLKGFATTVVTKLAVAGAVNFEVEKDEKPDPYTRGPLWKFLKPDAQKGQTADPAAAEDMLSALANTPAATRLVDENPDPAKLAEYGLGPVTGRPAMPGDPPAPRLRVAVGIRDNIDPADKERVYEFGNPLPGDPNLVYARQAGRTVVFALPKALVDRFSGDLRDKTIFRFDPAQVTRVNLKGWKGATGGVQDLHFEKNKDGAWAVVHSTIPGYALDPAKVTAFVTALSRARVKEFVNGPPTLAMGFGDPKESLNVHLTIAGQPGIILDLWSPTDNGASYFAGVSLRPPTDPVVKLDAAPLKAYKDSPAGFAK